MVLHFLLKVQLIPLLKVLGMGVVLLILSAVAWFVWNDYQDRLKMFDRKQHRWVARDAEGLVREMLEVSGYRNIQRVESGDAQEIDTVCLDDDGRLAVVRYKPYVHDHEVTDSDIREFAPVVNNHAASYGIFITPSRLTKKAMKEAANRGIRLYGRRDLPYIIRGDVRI